MCLTDGIAIVERFTGDILKKISKPIQSSREYIYIRELPNIDKQSMALWVDKKTITLIDFSQDLMVPVFMFACNLIYGAWCAFTWGKFTLFDYGVYTNMIWNSAHGAPFKVLIDRSYLGTHLSFSLAILGVFFWIFDHA